MLVGLRSVTIVFEAMFRVRYRAPHVSTRSSDNKTPPLEGAVRFVTVVSYCVRW